MKIFFIETPVQGIFAAPISSKGIPPTLSRGLNVEQTPGKRQPPRWRLNRGGWYGVGAARSEADYRMPYNGHAWQQGAGPCAFAPSPWVGLKTNRPKTFTDGLGRLATREIARRWSSADNHQCASYAGYACLILCPV